MDPKFQDLHISGTKLLVHFMISIAQIRPNGTKSHQLVMLKHNCNFIPDTVVAYVIKTTAKFTREIVTVSNILPDPV